MYDLVVVGAGIEGLATAYSAAKRHRKVLLLEQHKWPHHLGSSQGKSRIIRRAHLDDLYAGLMDEAFGGWMELERETGQKLYVNCGMVVFGSPSNPEISSYAQSLGHRCQKMTAREMQQRFPGFTPSDEYVGLYDSEGGILLADKAMTAYMAMFKKYGGEFRSETRVNDLKQHADGTVKVQTSSGMIETKAVVLATGPWTAQMLDWVANVKIPTEAHETCVMYWKLNGKANYSGAIFPVLLYSEERGKGQQPYHFFFKPSIEDTRTLNCGIHYGLKFEAGSKPGSKTLLSNYMGLTKRGWSKFLPGLDFRKPTSIEGCVYTENMADDDYIIDRLDSMSNVFFATGFTGSGFKMAPVLGKCLALMSMGEPIGHDFSKFKIRRFKQTSKL